MVAITRAGIALDKRERIETLAIPFLGLNLESELGVIVARLEDGSGSGGLDRLGVLRGRVGHAGIIPHSELVSRGKARKVSAVSACHY